MDILTHTLSGVAIGTVISSFSKNGLKEKISIIGLGGFGSLLPDCDAISLWSGFDKTFGRLFSLEHTGREIYASKFWYSHHGFFHSIAAGLLIGLIIGLVIYLFSSRFKNIHFKNLINFYKNQLLVLLSFVSGYIIHLLEDMPTPASVWGGVNFFGPFDIYTGGTGEIWWWNNYDIFLIVLSVVLLNFLVLIFKRFIKIDTKILTLAFFILGLSFSIIQIKSREISFNYVGDTPKFQYYEAKSKEIQQQLLGKNIYNIMVKFDNKVKLNF